MNMPHCNDDVRNLSCVIEEEVAEFSRLLTALKRKLSSQPAASCVPHFSDILSKISRVTATLGRGGNVTLMSPEEFGSMLQGFIVPVQLRNYKDGIVRRVMNRLHRNTILALNTGEDPTGDGVRLWKKLEDQYCSIMQHLETQSKALRLMPASIARCHAKQARLSVQLAIGSKHSDYDSLTICTIGTESGQVSFSLGDAGADSHVLNTFLHDSAQRESIRETLGGLLQSMQESPEEGGGSCCAGKVDCHESMESADPMISEGFSCQQSLRRQSI
jgi:hypothetical protein